MLLKTLAFAFMITVSAPCLAQSACGSKPTAKPDIEGHYIDNFGGMQEVLDHYWISGQYVFEICSIDNNKHQLVVLNEAENPTDPGKFSRFDWIRYSNRLWYCQTVYNAATESEAGVAPSADATDPRTSGCGGKFEWSSLSKLSP